MNGSDGALAGTSFLFCAPPRPPAHTFESLPRFRLKFALVVCFLGFRWAHQISGLTLEWMLVWNSG